MELDLMIEQLEMILNQRFKDNIPYAIRLGLENVKSARLIDSVQPLLDIADEMEAAQLKAEGKLQ